MTAKLDEYGQPVVETFTQENSEDTFQVNDKIVEKIRAESDVWSEVISDMYLEIYKNTENKELAHQITSMWFSSQLLGLGDA